MPIDITGTMVHPIPNWEERVEALCNPDNFCVLIHYDPSVETLYQYPLTIEESMRLSHKLDLVERYAAVMAAGMLKGTIKFPHDDWTLEQWFAHIIGEGADKANYDMLAFEAFEKLPGGC